jgi:hypothetical protein
LRPRRKEQKTTSLGDSSRATRCPKGRPKGGRVKLSERFLTTLAQDYDRHGASVIQYVRQNDPSTYLRIVASIVPKESLARLEVSGEVQIKTRTQEILNAYRLIGENVEEAEILDG